MITPQEPLNPHPEALYYTLHTQVRAEAINAASRVSYLASSIMFLESRRGLYRESSRNLNSGSLMGLRLVAVRIMTSYFRDHVD